MYKHITRDDRAVIADGRRRGESYREIADRIGKHKSSVYREVQRNQTDNDSYYVADADKQAGKRRKEAKTAYRKIENDPELADRIENRLEPFVSPEVVAHEEGIHH